jgi:hypothetical protein
MTQLRFHPGSISNYFDTVLRGIGKRGSSFSDIDAVAHDRDTHRFLVQEFKREGETINQGQHWMLKDLAALPQHFTVWHVEKRVDGQIGFAEFGSSSRVISVREYQARYAAWWANGPFELEDFSRTAPPLAPLTQPLMATDICWSGSGHAAREPGQEG